MLTSFVSKALAAVFSGLPGREKIWNPGIRFPEIFASSRKIFTDFVKKKFEMKFLKKIFEVFVVNRQSSYVIGRPIH